MRRMTLALALAFVAAPRARAGDDYPIKVYPCPRLSAGPKIDGDLSDACWQAAPLVSGFTRYNKPQLMPVQTSFRAAHDAGHLYFAVRCDEPAIDRVTPTHAGRDSGGVFRGEAIEIFLDPRHDHANYYQFGVNFAGSFYDSRKSDPTWNSQSRLKTRPAGKGWTLEMAIPWKDLGLAEAKAGTVVGFNVCRDRHAGGAREWSNWSQTKANFHDPVRFAHLVLAPTPEALAGLAPEVRKGDRRGPIVIFGHAGEARKAYLAMARAALGRLDALLARLADEGKRERSDAARAEVAWRLEQARHEVRPYRDRIDSGRALDAVEWTRMSIRMVALERRLRQLLWDARLAALLKEI